MIKILTAITITLSFIVCKNSKQIARTKQLDFGKFSIQVPLSWEKVELRGIDSYVGLIKIDSVDAILFNLGWHR